MKSPALAIKVVSTELDQLMRNLVCEVESALKEATECIEIGFTRTAEDAAVSAVRALRDFRRVAAAVSVIEEVAARRSK